MITADTISEAYYKVLESNDKIPYTQRGAAFVYTEMKKLLGVDDGVFEPEPILNSSADDRSVRHLTFKILNKIVDKPSEEG